MISVHCGQYFASRMHTAPDPPVISDCYMNADGLAIVKWLPSAESEEHQVPGSEFFVDYAEIGKATPRHRSGSKTSESLVE